MPEPRDRIVDLEGAAPATPPTLRDRAVIGALTAGCIAIGLVVLVTRAPQPLGTVASPVSALASPSAAPPARLILDKPDLTTPDDIEVKCWQVPGSGTTTIARVCVYGSSDEPAITIDPGNVLPWERSISRGVSPPVLIPPTRP